MTANKADKQEAAAPRPEDTDLSSGADNDDPNPDQRGGGGGDEEEKEKEKEKERKKEYDVGYKKTPRHTRWEKGQSGNPTGRARPRATRKREPQLGQVADEFFCELFKILSRPVGAKQGAVRRRTGVQTLAAALYKDALLNDGKARNFILNALIKPGMDPGMLERRRPEEDRHEQIKTLARYVFDPSVSMEELERAAHDVDKLHDFHDRRIADLDSSASRTDDGAGPQPTED